MKERGRLSKSRYIAFLQCPKLFYYSVKLRDQIPPFDAATQFRLDQGGEGKENILKTLLKYCERDTVAMVDILGKLRGV